MNDHRQSSLSPDADSETSAFILDNRDGQATAGHSGRNRAMVTGSGEALADKEAVRIAIRQFSDAELEREERLMRKISHRAQGIADACARERKQRKRRFHPSD